MWEGKGGREEGAVYCHRKRGRGEKGHSTKNVERTFRLFGSRLSRIEDLNGTFLLLLNSESVELSTPLGKE